MVLFVWAKLGDILIGCVFYRLINGVWGCWEKWVCLLEKYFIKNLLTILTIQKVRQPKNMTRKVQQKMIK